MTELTVEWFTNHYRKNYELIQKLKKAETLRRNQKPKKISKEASQNFCIYCRGRNPCLQNRQ